MEGHRLATFCLFRLMFPIQPRADRYVEGKSCKEDPVASKEDAGDENDGDDDDCNCDGTGAVQDRRAVFWSTRQGVYFSYTYR
jgi:hypothetical protein